MRIQLIMDIMVEDKHGMIEGRILDVTREGDGRHGRPRWFVMGDAGEEVGILTREAKVISKAAYLPIATDTHPCLACEESLELYGHLPSTCAVCGERR